MILMYTVIPGHAAASNPESRATTSEFSDVQLHIKVRSFASPRNDGIS